MILLPLLSLLVWLLAYRRRGQGLLVAFAAALVTCGVAVSLATELQSVLHLLTPVGSAVAWGIVIATGAFAARRAGAAVEAIEWPTWDEAVPVVVLLALTALVAVVSAPNSYDGLTYHLVRVERWIAQGSLDPFATYNTRQLFMPSWSEYAMLQLRLLSGGDRFANMVQWLGLVGACGGAALLARALGGGRTAAAMAAAAVATLPMAVAQASGTQTDVVAACWAVIACGFAYRLLTVAPRRTDLLLAALAFGLAAATKQTALLFAGAVLLPVVGVLAWERRHRWWIGLGSAMLASVALIAGPQLARNVKVFGDWRGDPVWIADAAMATKAPDQVAANVLRNLSLHFGTPSDDVNAAVVDGVAAVSRMIGANPDDPRTTWNPRFIPTPWNTHEESAPNPLHLLLVLGCLVGLIWVRPARIQGWFLVALAAGLIVFSADLKWQSYNSRLHTPWFVLALAWAAILLERLPRAWRRAVLVVLTAGALPVAIFNYTRPLIAGTAMAPRPSMLRIPRELGYFMYDPALARPYLDVAHRIAESGCPDVGTRTWPDAWEYAVMALVRNAGSAARFRPIGVPNRSARFAEPSRAPCLLLQIWPRAETPPAWAAGWRPLAAWRGPPNAPGIALFAPPP